MSFPPSNTLLNIDQSIPGTTNGVAPTSATVTSTVMQNAVSATGNGTTLDVSGKSVAVLQITGTFVATINFEASNDDTNWFAINATQIGVDTLLASTKVAGLYSLSVGGIKSIRARVTWTSGTSVTVSGRATLADSSNNTATASRTGSVEFTRPSGTTPDYSINDAIGAASGSAILEFTNFGNPGEQIIINTIEYEVDVAGLGTMSSFVMHFYNASPTAIADNAAWDLISADRSKYQGNMQLFQPTDLGSTLWSQNDNLGKPVVLSSTSLFAILKTDAAFTPTASAVHKINLRGFKV